MKYIELKKIIKSKISVRCSAFVIQKNIEYRLMNKDLRINFFYEQI